MYNRGGGNRSIVVCGSNDASCEELAIDAHGLPAVKSWRSFTSLPHALAGGCMLCVNNEVRVCRRHSSSNTLCCSCTILVVSIMKDRLWTMCMCTTRRVNGGRQRRLFLNRFFLYHKCTMLNCRGFVCGGQSTGEVLSLLFFSKMATPSRPYYHPTTLRSSTIRPSTTPM